MAKYVIALGTTWLRICIAHRSFIFSPSVSLCFVFLSVLVGFQALLKFPFFLVDSMVAPVQTTRGRSTVYRSYTSLTSFLSTC